MKNKNKLKYLTLGILLTGAVGFSTLAVKQVQVKTENESVVNINRENKKLVSYEDNENLIIFNANECNNYTWVNFFNTLVDEFSANDITISLALDDETYYFEETNLNYDNTDSYYYIDFQSSNDDIYTLVLSDDYVSYFSANGYTASYEDYKWLLYNVTNLEIVNFTSDLYITFNTNYQLYKDEIVLDIQANESSYGESIITAISSGLGLIPDLAQEFLTGFTTLFWDSAQEKLTDFGTFALVFLGVAITMAVVKLCLAILRSNTGA